MWWDPTYSFGLDGGQDVDAGVELEDEGGTGSIPVITP